MPPLTPAGISSRIFTCCVDSVTFPVAPPLQGDASRIILGMLDALDSAIDGAVLQVQLVCWLTSPCSDAHQSVMSSWDSGYPSGKVMLQHDLHNVTGMKWKMLPPSTHGKAWYLHVISRFVKTMEYAEATHCLVFHLTNNTCMNMTMLQDITKWVWDTLKNQCSHPTKKRGHKMVCNRDYNFQYWVTRHLFRPWFWGLKLKVIVHQVTLCLATSA